MASLGFSLDGPTPAVNDRIRGLAGYFDQVLAAIRLVRGAKEALASRTPALTIHCTVSSRNVELLPDMVSVARRAGVPAISFQYLSVVAEEVVESTNRRMGTRVAGMHNYTGIPRALLLTAAQIDRLDAILAAVRTRARDEDVSVEMDSALEAPGHRGLAEGRFPVTRCRAAWESAVITPIGDVHVCSMFTEHALGNVRRDGIAGIWNGEAAQRMRAELGRGLPDICQQCCQQHADADSTWDKVRARARGLQQRITG
jgi:radical SAM protein with 4Fe4S-binding SPASM domain